MGKVMSLISTTIDGFADRDYVIIDAAFFDFTHKLLSGTSTIAFGRNTFEQFQNRWPLILENEDEPGWKVKMARVLNDKHKAVYSSTLKTTTWSNSGIVQNLDAGSINAYKEEGKEGLLTLGSLQLVTALTAMKLIDDYYFCIQPFIAGNGEERLFDKLKPAGKPLKYVDSTQLESGVHIIHYQPEN